MIDHREEVKELILLAYRMYFIKYNYSFSLCAQNFQNSILRHANKVYEVIKEKEHLEKLIAAEIKTAYRSTLGHITIRITDLDKFISEFIIWRAKELHDILT